MFFPGSTVRLTCRFRDLLSKTDFDLPIMDKNDVDYYAIVVPNNAGTMAIAVANKSTSLHPLITAFDASKTQIASQYNAASGGDATIKVKAQPGTLYVRVSDYYSDGSGDYMLTVTKQ
jgi:hypothetical protein